MLREDKRAHIEKQLQSKTPIYESERVARFFTKQVVTGWNERMSMSCPAASRPPRRPGPRALDYDADSAILRPTARAFTGASLLGRGGKP